MHYVALHTSLLNILIAPVCFSANSFSGYVTRTSTHLDGSRNMSHGLAAVNDRCLLSALQVSRSDYLGGRRAAVMSIQ